MPALPGPLNVFNHKTNVDVYKRQERIFGVGFRRGCEVFRNISHHGKTLSLGQFRQGVQHFFLSICFQGGAEPLVDFFPAGDKHGLSLGGELISCTGKYRSHGFVLMGRGYRAEKFGADKVHQLALTFRKAGEALFYKFGRGKDGVVVRYLFAVQHLSLIHI